MMGDGTCTPLKRTAAGAGAFEGACTLWSATFIAVARLKDNYQDTQPLLPIEMAKMRAAMCATSSLPL